MKISSREESERPYAHGDAAVSYRSEVPQKTRRTFGGVYRVTKMGSYGTWLYDVVYHFSSLSKHRQKNVACDARLDRGAADVRVPNHAVQSGEVASIKRGLLRGLLESSPGQTAVWFGIQKVSNM
jgi:hypothetical protein